MTRMRTAAGVLAAIKAEDPESEVTLHFIRALINANKVPVVPVGRKKLVDVDAVVTFLADGAPTAEAKSLVGQIRRVAV